MTEFIDCLVTMPVTESERLRAQLLTGSPHATIGAFLVAALNDHLAGLAQKPVQAQVKETLTVLQTMDGRRVACRDYRLTVAEPAQRFRLSNLQKMESDPVNWLVRIANRYIEKLFEPSSASDIVPDRPRAALYRLMGCGDPSDPSP